MKETLLALSFGFGALILATHAGFAAPTCGPRDAVTSALADRYGETRRGVGLGDGNMVMEVYASSETGTWTILITRPDGLSCLAASGSGYEALTDAMPEGDPA